MRTTLLLFISLLFISTNDAFSQEWRDDFDPLVTDTLEIKQSDFYKKRFNKKVDFRRTKFVSKAEFSEADFALTTNFRKSKFDTTADFSHTKFDSLAPANFTEVEFHSIADFTHVEFHSTADFSWVKFFNKAQYDQAKFDSSSNFESTEYHKDAIFTGAEFDTVTFNYSRFYSLANFNNASFDSTASFEGAHFDSMANFFAVKFGEIVIFKDAQFNGQSNFKGSRLPKFIDFSEVTNIAVEIDLTKAKGNPKYNVCYINLTDAAIDKFRFRYKRFKLWPPGDTTEYELKANVYEDLLKKQKDEGFTQSYEILDKEYREFQYTDPGAGKGSWGKFLNWVDKNWWEYGYNKELIIRNALIIFLILSFINSFFLKYLITQVYTNEKICKLIEKRESKNEFIRWFDSLRYSIFYTAVIFFSFNFDMDKLNYAGNLDGWKIFNLTYFMVIYLGGVVCMAYLANYIITI